MTSILLLAGSPSPSSRSARLLAHAGEQLAAQGHATTVLHVRDLPAQALLHADFADGAVQAALARVAAASAVVVATPIYKAAYSGILKAFLDLLPQDGLTGKQVLPMATGGSPAHMLALDYALRPVLASLGARHVLPGIYATDSQVQWHADTGLALDPDIARRVQDGVAHLLDGLTAAQTAPSSAPRAAGAEPQSGSRLIHSAPAAAGA